MDISLCKTLYINISLQNIYSSFYVYKTEKES